MNERYSRTKEDFWTRYESGYLARHCSKYFHIWWDADKFNWRYSDYLALYCPEYFETWWDADRFDWRRSEFLPEYCSEYKHIWSKEYVKRLLKDEV